MNWKDYHEEICPYWVFVLTTNSEIRLVGRFVTALDAKAFVDSSNALDFKNHEEMSYFMVCTGLPF